MELIEVEAFVAVARHGGFTRAAAALELSQPAISRRIELLERELGTAMFDRLPGGVRLADAGTAFLPHALAALAALRDGAEAARAAGHGEGGAVALAIVGALVGTAVAGALRRYRAQYPQVRLTLRTADSEAVSALVQRGDAHLGVRYFPAAEPGLESTVLHHELLVVVAAAGQPIAHGRPVEPAALRGESWVAVDAALLRHLLAGAGLAAPEIIAVDGRAAQLQLVAAGFGLALVPEEIAADDLHRGALRRVDVPALPQRIPLAAVFRRRAPRTQPVQRLLSALVSAYRPAGRAEPTRQSRQ